jgi:hypothetical protein
MQICRDHAEKITHERQQLGLMKAKLRLEFIGIDPEDRALDGYVCPLCNADATCCTSRAADGKFLLTIKSDMGKP